eukprot:SM000018S03614  [mRNA]  locus=s18:372862:379254:+ [translate_table: standard]
MARGGLRQSAIGHVHIGQAAGRSSAPLSWLVSAFWPWPQLGGGGGGGSGGGGGGCGVKREPVVYQYALDDDDDVNNSRRAVVKRDGRPEPFMRPASWAAQAGGREGHRATTGSGAAAIAANGVTQDLLDSAERKRKREAGEAAPSQAAATANLSRPGWQALGHLPSTTTDIMRISGGTSNEQPVDEEYDEGPDEDYNEPSPKQKKVCTCTAIFSSTPEEVAIAADGGNSRVVEASDDSEPPLGEDDDEDDLEDGPEGEEEPTTDHLVLAQFDKVRMINAPHAGPKSSIRAIWMVSRAKTKPNKWRCTLKDGIMNLNGKDILFVQSAIGNAQFLQAAGWSSAALSDGLSPLSWPWPQLGGGGGGGGGAGGAGGVKREPVVYQYALDDDDDVDDGRRAAVKRDGRPEPFMRPASWATQSGGREGHRVTTDCGAAATAANGVTQDLLDSAKRKRKREGGEAAPSQAAATANLSRPGWQALGQLASTTTDIMRINGGTSDEPPVDEEYDEGPDEDYNEPEPEENAPEEVAVAADGGSSGVVEASDDSEPPLGEDDDEDDLEDGPEGEEEPTTDHLVLAQFDKVSRAKNKWRCTLKDGVMNLNGKDILPRENSSFEQPGGEQASASPLTGTTFFRPLLATLHICWPPEPLPAFSPPAVGPSSLPVFLLDYQLCCGTGPAASGACGDHLEGRIAQTTGCN